MSVTGKHANSDVHLAVGGDDAFARPMAVTIRSALECASPSRTVVVHVLDAGISASSRRSLELSWKISRTSVMWHSIDPSILATFPVSHHVSAAAYSRLLLGAMMPSSLEKVLYLDSDLLVLSDVGELWDIDVANVACAAAQDVAAPWIDSKVVMSDDPGKLALVGDATPVPNYPALGLSASDPYFNSGVMLVNLRRWRTEHYAEQMFRCLHDHRASVRWWDQYALNVVLYKRWLPLHPRWNQGSHIDRYKTWTDSPFDQQAFEETRDSPSIVHFTTEYKPWLLHYVGKHRRQWFEVLDRTHWRGWRPGSKAQRIRTVLNGYRKVVSAKLGFRPR